MVIRHRTKYPRTIAIGEAEIMLRGACYRNVYLWQLNGTTSAFNHLREMPVGGQELLESLNIYHRKGCFRIW